MTPRRHRRTTAVWRKVLALSGRDRRELAEAWLALVGVRLALRIRSVPRIQAALGRWKKDSGAEPSGAAEQAERLARWVEAAARRVPTRAECLERSLVLWWMLGRRGIDADLKIGVQRAQTALKAHAWVEHRGRPLGRDRTYAERYTPFPEPLAGTKG